MIEMHKHYPRAGVDLKFQWARHYQGSAAWLGGVQMILIAHVYGG